ncbi:MAG: prepilin peptidase [Acidimicrobiales bacterium]
MALRAVPSPSRLPRAVVVTDLATRKIPEAVVLPAYPLGAGLLAVASASGGQWSAFASAGAAMALLGGFYLAIGLAFPAGMGIGDIQLGGLLGLCRLF